MKGIPTYCACGETNSVDHSLICKLGGCTSMRHNSVRDSEAQIMREVCRDGSGTPGLPRLPFELPTEEVIKANCSLSAP